MLHVFLLSGISDFCYFYFDCIGTTLDIRDKTLDTGRRGWYPFEDREFPVLGIFMLKYERS